MCEQIFDLPQGGGQFHAIVPMTSSENDIDILNTACILGQQRRDPTIHVELF
jgi:hypothetical protein